MSLSRPAFEEALKSLGLTVETDGTHYVHSTAGRYAPLISTIITFDDDEAGATIVATLPDAVEPAKRAAVYELFNHVHGQSLWNIRYHLDDDGRVLCIGKFSLWGRPFNSVQLGDIIYSQLVTTDRLYPCLDGILRENQNATEAFKKFFIQKNASGIDES